MTSYFIASIDAIGNISNCSYSPYNSSSVFRGSEKLLDEKRIPTSVFRSIEYIIYLRLFS